jgi:hypothetical protein
MPLLVMPPPAAAVFPVTAHSATVRTPRLRMPPPYTSVPFRTVTPDREAVIGPNSNTRLVPPASIASRPAPGPSTRTSAVM